ncbi:MAG: glutamyl-tRNA reductase [bacterium]
MATNNWQLTVCGISHRTSSLAEREPLQIGHDEIAAAQSTFRGLPGVMESIIVATCNRVEFYSVAERQASPFKTATSFYQAIRGIDISNLEEKFYTRRSKHAADHLFRVTAGLDSMVLGENQILRQVKDAYSSACAVKATGKVIHRLFHQAFRIGKQVRTDTEMGQGACSVSSASMEMLRHKIGDLKAPIVLFVGINQMIHLAANGLNRPDGAKFLFANRTVEKAVEFAGRYGATGHSLQELPHLLGRADLVVTCTGSTRPVITREMIDIVMAARTDRRLTIMDMAIPRDVEIAKDHHADIDLFDLEDVQAFVRNQQKKREKAIPQSEEIVQYRLDEFMYWFDHVRHEPAYNGMGSSFEAARQQELGDVLAKLSPELRREVDDASRRLMTRLLRIKTTTTQSPGKSE